MRRLTPTHGLLALTAIVGLILIGCSADDLAVDEETGGFADAISVVEGDIDDAADHDEADTDHSDDEAEPGGDADMVIEVAMVDFGYGPESFEIPVGSTVRFEFTNEGVVPHEAMLGDLQFQLEQETSGDEHGAGHHTDGPSVFLEPGGSTTLTVTFNQAGELVMGCHIPGHWDAGMLAEIAVV